MHFTHNVGWGGERCVIIWPEENWNPIVGQQLISLPLFYLPSSSNTFLIFHGTSMHWFTIENIKNLLSSSSGSLPSETFSDYNCKHKTQMQDVMMQWNKLFSIIRLPPPNILLPLIPISSPNHKCLWCKPHIFPSQNPTDWPGQWPWARMCQNSHFAHKLIPYHPKNKQCLSNLHSYKYFSLARNVPDMLTPVSIDPG